MTLSNLKIALGSDHAGFELKEKIKKELENKYKIIDLGTDSKTSVDYPDFGEKVARAILDKEADFGIIICGTGIGISIAANRHKGIRAAVCHNEETAKLAREHNNANILALGARIVDEDTALKCVKKFLETDFEGGRHSNRVAKLG